MKRGAPIFDPNPIPVVDAKSAVAELRREYAMPSPTWPCVLLSKLMPLCDAHDALVAALRDIEDIFDGQEDCDDGVPNDAMRAMTIISAALAKAGAQ